MIRAILSIILMVGAALLVLAGGLRAWPFLLIWAISGSSFFVGSLLIPGGDDAKEILKGGIGTALLGIPFSYGVFWLIGRIST